MAMQRLVVQSSRLPPLLSQAGGLRYGEHNVTEALDDAPPAEIEAIMVSEIEQLLDDLRDEELRAIALAKIAGSSNAEIAAQRNCSQRTIERRIETHPRQMETP